MAKRARVTLGRASTLLVAFWLALAAPGAVADVGAPTRGPVTNLPLPRFVSLKVDEANVRRGPSLTHRIDWVFKARGMPLEVIGEYGNWRRVRDQDGVGGWVHYTLLSGARSGLVVNDLAPLLARANAAAALKARLEAGVIVALDRCGADFCHARAGKARGWMAKSDLWGVGPEDEFD